MPEKDWRGIGEPSGFSNPIPMLGEYPYRNEIIGKR
jgi:hypothetical protein